ncbi:hypothetical protein HKB29_02235, partial [Vibrio parahaemolyticus]|nr:hypothetical protein [Vibrio parahaemolyticus]
AVLEVGEIKHNGEIEWSAVHGPINIDSHVLQVTLTDLKRAGLGVECSNQTWAVGQ